MGHKFLKRYLSLSLETTLVVTFLAVYMYRVGPMCFPTQTEGAASALYCVWGKETAEAGRSWRYAMYLFVSSYSQQWVSISTGTGKLTHILWE